MKCIICEEEFKIIKNGRGGLNRKICYSCMPDKLNKYERNSLRRKLFMEKTTLHKLNMGCCKCGYNKCSNALEWHHVDGDNKINEPSNILRYSLDDYLKEIEKCILLCSNCHREYHENINL